MYYVVHKFPNLSRAVIHLGTHAHPIVDNECKESFQDIKNMVADEVCRMPTATILVIVLSVNKTFLSCHLFNMMEKVMWSFSKVKNLIKCC
jgi:hypothetical protein